MTGRGIRWTPEMREAARQRAKAKCTPESRAHLSAWQLKHWTQERREATRQIQLARNAQRLADHLGALRTAWASAKPAARKAFLAQIAPKEAPPAIRARPIHNCPARAIARQIERLCEVIDLLRCPLIDAPGPRTDS